MRHCNPCQYFNVKQNTSAFANKFLNFNRHHFLLIAFFLILVLCLFSDYITVIKSNYERHYISHPFLQPEKTEPIKDFKEDYTSDQIVTFLDRKSAGNLFKQKNDFTAKKTNRTLFVEIDEIKKTSTNIFFIETRCSTEQTMKRFKNIKGFVLNVRQCCAIESTALMNPDHQIYIFHSCPLNDDFLDYSPKFIVKLFTYPNVHIMRVNTATLFHGSPVEELYNQKQLEKSKHPIAHASDILRMIILWNFGGTYSDLDVVTIRPLAGLKTNWAGLQDRSFIANGVINFEPHGVAHEILLEGLQYVNKHFKPNKWPDNGPNLLTRLILEECKVSTAMEARTNCHGNFTVFKTYVLYPLYYNHCKDFFNDYLGGRIVKFVKSSVVYMVHFWGKMTEAFEGRVGSSQAYALLAEEFCPRVINSCGLYF